MIVDPPDRATFERYMQPFARAGTVEILAASSCEVVVGRGSCEASVG